MARQQPELGTKSPFRLRLGQNIDRFRGVNREADPAAIRDDQFQDAVNIRLTAAGKVTPRGGQSKVNTTAMDGCIEALVDDEIGDGIGKLYWANGTNKLFTYSNTQFPKVQVKAIETTKDGSIVGAYDTYAVLADDAADASIRSVLATQDPDAIIEDQFTIASQTVRDAMRLDTNLFLLVSTVLGNAKVYVWDGSSASLSDDSGVVPGSIFGNLATLGSSIYYLVPHAATGLIRKYTAGVWSTEATFTDENVRHLVGFNNKLYVFSVNGGQAAIYEVTGGGLTLRHTYSGVSSTSIKSVCVYGGYLWFVVSKDGLGNGVTLGNFDGTTWTEDLVTTFLSDAEQAEYILAVAPDGAAMVCLEDVDISEGAESLGLSRSSADGLTWTTVAVDGDVFEAGIDGVDPERYFRLVQI